MPPMLIAAAPWIVGGLLALSTAGAIGAAANGSLPGDPLYGIKVNVNENVKKGLAMSPEADANVAADLAIRRLEEAEALAANNDLDAEARLGLESRFVNLSNEALESAAVAAESSPKTGADLAADFAARLEGHGCTMAALYGNADGAEEAQLRAIGGRILGEQDKAQNAVLTISGTGGTDGSALATGDALLRNAQNNVSALRAAVASAPATMTPGLLSGLKTNLSLAESALANGRTKLNEGNFDQAFALIASADALADGGNLLVDLSAEGNGRGGAGAEAGDAINGDLEVNGGAGGSASGTVETGSGSSTIDAGAGADGSTNTGGSVDLPNTDATDILDLNSGSGNETIIDLGL